MYGSIFWSVTRKPRASSSEPMEADASPLPSDDTTPPVTKMYFVGTSSLLPGRQPVSNILDFRLSVPDLAVEPAITKAIEHLRHRRTPSDPQLDHFLAAQYRTNASRRVDPPRHRLPDRRISPEPKRGQLEVGAFAQKPGALRRRRRRPESRCEPVGGLERAGRAGQ